MKRQLFTFLVSFSFIQVMHTQVTGMWKSTDHIDDTERSVVEIYEKNGKFYGRVEKLLPAATVTHCTGCDGDQKNKSIVGMVIMSDIIKDGDKGTDGKILDPTNGKWYSCDIELVSPDKLKVIGYVGFPLLGKTMYWKRA
jgi:uncharacterized protein (DUF2147 family)